MLQVGEVGTLHKPIPVAALSKALVCCFCHAGMAGSNLGKDTEFCLSSVVYCQVYVSATARLLIQWSPTECCVSECYRETSHRRLRPDVGCPAMGKNTYFMITKKYIETLYCPTNAHKLYNTQTIKIFKIIKSSPTCFGSRKIINREPHPVLS